MIKLRVFALSIVSICLLGALNKVFAFDYNNFDLRSESVTVKGDSWAFKDKSISSLFYDEGTTDIMKEVFVREAEKSGDVVSLHSNEPVTVRKMFLTQALTAPYICISVGVSGDCYWLPIFLLNTAKGN